MVSLKPYSIIYLACLVTYNFAFKVQVHSKCNHPVNDLYLLALLPPALYTLPTIKYFMGQVPSLEKHRSSR